MKKIILIVVAVIAVVALVSLFVWRQQSGYTKVLTAKIAKQDLATIVSGTGQIKPTTYVNVGANVMGRVTHFAVKEGDTVKKGKPLCILEAMKLMNEYQAEFDMEVVAILVDNGNMVEFGAPLFEVRRV